MVRYALLQLQNLQEGAGHVAGQQTGKQANLPIWLAGRGCTTVSPVLEMLGALPWNYEPQASRTIKATT